MISISSGLRSAMVTNYGLGVMMQYGHIRVYSGPQPPSADYPPTGTLLGIVSTDGVTPLPGVFAGGLAFAGGLDAGSLVMSGNWVLKGVAEGVPGWWRFVWNDTDNDSFSTYYPRIDGAEGDSFSLGAASISVATNTPISSFLLVLPAN